MPTSPLESLIAKANSLYTLPAVAMEVLQLTGSEKVDTRALKECIERDPALVAKLLKVVNSSLFGLSGKIENLTQAIALLGIKPLKLLVLGFSLPSNLLADIDAEQLARYWRGALTRAVAARQLVESQWKAPGDDAFLVALLQDIGKLVLLQQVGKPYSRFLEQVEHEGGQLVEFERHSLGFDHRQLTVALLRRWSLPEVYATSIECKVSQENTARQYVGEVSIPQALELANRMVELVDGHRLQVLPELLEKGQQYCGVTNDDLSRLVAEIQPRVEQLAAVLQVEVGATQQYTQVLVEAHRQMSQVAAEAAGMLMLTEDKLAEQVLQESQDLQHAIHDFMATPQKKGEPSDMSEPRAHGAEEPARGPRGRTTTTGADKATARRRLLEVVDQHAQECRQHRYGMSLVCVEVVAEGSVELETEATAALHSALQPLMEEYDLSSSQLIRLGASAYGMMLLNTERREAVEITQRLADLVASSNAAVPVHVKAGAAAIAGIPKGWEAERLVSAAENCLAAAHHAGGTAVKSIEVY